MKKLLINMCLGLAFGASDVIAQNNALNFDGVNDYVNLNSLCDEASDPFVGLESYTIEFWIQADRMAQTNLRPALFAINLPPNPIATAPMNVLLFTLGSTAITDGILSVSTTGGGQGIATPWVVGDLQCHHIVFVRLDDVQNARVYVDGQLVAFNLPTPPRVREGFRVSLGQEYDPVSPITSQFYKGNMDNLQIWRTVRTEAEIRSDMNSTSASLDPDQIAFYDFNEGVASQNNTSPPINVLNDLTASAENGILENFGLRGDSSNWILNSCDGAICCESPNSIRNGNFEFGFNHYSSDYFQEATYSINSVNPGEFAIVNSMDAFNISSNWNVTDHSGCNGFNFTDFMIVNGRTQQPVGSVAAIVKQRLILTEGKEYKFCMRVKNLSQCSFDIQPRISVDIVGSNWTISSPYTGGFIQINTDQTDDCDWFLFEGTFICNDQDARFRVYLDETGNGDGNDLAIDDISIQEKQMEDYFMMATTLSGNNTVTASLNSLTFADDNLNNLDCNLEELYTWTIEVAVGFNSTGLIWGSPVHGNGFSGWSLTTTFPGYTFSQGEIYKITLQVPTCPNSCFIDFESSVVIGSGIENWNEGDKITPEMLDMIENGRKSENQDRIIEAVSVKPNPSNGVFRVGLLNISTGTYTIENMQGAIIMEGSFSEMHSFSVDLENHEKGTYLLKIEVEGVSTLKKLLRM